MISAGSGTVRCFLPLPRTRSWASANFQILQLQRQDFARTQAVEQHEAHHGEIAEGAKTGPKPGDLLSRQRLDDASRLLEAETEGDIAVGTTVADRAASRIGALEMGMAAGDLLSEVESIQATNHRQAMIYSLRSRLGLLAQLMADTVQQCGLRDFGKSLGLALKPTSEVQQVIGVSAQ